MNNITMQLPKVKTAVIIISAWQFIESSASDNFIEKTDITILNTE